MHRVSLYNTQTALLLEIGQGGGFTVQQSVTTTHEDSTANKVSTSSSTLNGTGRSRTHREGACLCSQTYKRVQLWSVSESGEQC